MVTGTKKRIAVSGLSLWLLGSPCPMGFAAEAPPAPPVHSFLIGYLRIYAPLIEIDPADPTQASLYFTVENRAGAAARLIGATIDGVGTAMVDNPQSPAADPATGFGVLDLPPNRSVTLRPGNTRIALRGLQHPIREGDTLHGTLMFERAGPLPIDFPVQAPAQAGVEGATPATPSSPAELPPE